MSRYPWVQLRRVAKTGTGHTPSRSRPELWIEKERRIPWITLADVGRLRDGTLDEIFDTAECITAAGVAASSAVAHPVGTVVLSRTASVGFATMMGRPMAVSQDFMTWTPGPRLHNRFLLHFLRGFRPMILGLMHGSTHKTVYMPDLHALKAPLPSLDAQHGIADFLDCECARIDGLTAEVGAFASEAALALQSEVRALGVSSAQIRLRRLARTITGATPHESSQVSHGVGVPWFTPKSFRRREVGAPIRSYAPSAERLNQSRVACVGVVIIGATAGRVAYMPGGGAANQQIALVIPNPGTDPEFLAWSLWSRQSEIAALATTTTIPIIGIGTLGELQLDWPDGDARSKLVRKWAAVERNGQALTEEVRDLLRDLSEYRDALITEAVTGKLDVTKLSESRMAESLAAVREGERPEVLTS